MYTKQGTQSFIPLRKFEGLQSKQTIMKNPFLFAILFLLSTTLVLKAQDNNHVPGNLLVMCNSASSAEQLQEGFAFVKGMPTSLKVERCLSESMHIYLFSFNPNSINENTLLSAIRNATSVKIAQFNHYINERNTVPNDAQFGAMWDMDNTGANGGAGSIADSDIDAPEAWDITTGGLTAQGDTIVVAVVDGGFKLNHVDLNFWKNYQEIPNNGIDDDANGYIDDFDGWNGATATDNFASATHGTHVSGTVGAKGNNGIGVTGVNWNVKVMPISYGSGGASFEANVVASYAYARDQRRLYNQTNGAKGAFVVSTNSSFGVDLAFPASYPLWCAMYDSLGAVGILSAGATANANYNVDVQGDIPTACASDWLITVTNTKSNDQKTTGAGYGLTTIDLGSPGTNITSTYYTGSTDTYSSISGTSMATPHVAGTVALMLSVQCSQFIADYKANPSAMALVLKDSLLNATDPNANLNGITVTGGRLNLYHSVRAIQNYCAAVGIQELGGNNSFEITNVYPNPASQQLTVVINTFETASIIMTDVLGQEVKRISNQTAVNGKQLVKIDISGMSKGIYFVSLNTSNKKSSVVKVIVY